MRKKVILHLQSGDGDEGGIANYISLLINSKEMKKYSHIVVVKKIYKKLYFKFPLSKLMEFDCNYSVTNFLIRVFKLSHLLIINCLPSHRHLLSFPAIVQFILPLPFEKGPFKRISILFLPNLLVLAFKLLFAKHLTAFLGSILSDNVNP